MSQSSLTIDQLRELGKITGKRERSWALLNGVPVESVENGKFVRQYPSGKKVLVLNPNTNNEVEIPYE